MSRFGTKTGTDTIHKSQQMVKFDEITIEHPGIDSPALSLSMPMEIEPRKA
jgi:hypothetical protein